MGHQRLYVPSAASTGSRPFNTTLTTLACLVAGIISVQAQAADINGCENLSLVSQKDTSGCSASAGLNQRLEGSVLGGRNHNGSANYNRVNIAHGANIQGSVYGGFTNKKEANHNEVVIGHNVQIGKDDNSWDTGGEVNGGTSIESTADFNAVRIGDSAIVRGFISGGSAGDTNEAVINNVSASSNSVHIGNLSTIIESIWGGNGGKTASFNEVYIGNGVKVGREVHLTNGSGITGGTTSEKADFLSTEANSNVVHIGDDVAVTYVFGASATAPFSKNSTVNDNRVTIGNRSNTLFISGAEGWEASTVKNNTVTVGNDASAGEIYGAHSASGNVSGNTVQIGKNLVANYVTGGDAYSAVAGEGNAHNNTVVIGENATVKGLVIGGNALTNANGNTVILHKGFTVGGVGGGIALNDTTDNTVTLFAGKVEAGIVGGNVNNFKGNTLNLGSPKEGIEMNKLSAGEVKNFETINFYLPQNVRNNDVVMKLTGDYPEALGNTTVNAYVPGNADLSSGDVVHLIQIDKEGVLGWTGQGHVYQGVTLAHDLASIEADKTEKNLDLVLKRNVKQVTTTASVNNTGTAATAGAATATIANPVTTVNPKTKSLVQGRLVSPALINGSADHLSGGLESLYQNTNVNIAGENGNAFANVRADNREITTGSHVDLKGMAFDAGYARNRPLGSGNWMYGVAAEYGYSHYKTYLDDGTTGKGKAWNLGVNLFTNYLWNNGVYVQGSVRTGRVWSDYRSNDFVHAGGNSVTYDSKSNYIAGHTGFGKLWKFGGANTLDTYVKYFYAHTSGDKVKLSSGETYDFSSVRSKRGRVGMQYNRDLNNAGVHFGMAYEREWGGDVRAQYQGNALPTPTMKGGTMIGEAGMYYKFHGKKVNTSLQGFSGRRQGVGIRLGLEF
ncbi:autotransporter domain-containing protein [Neisseria sp. CCUG12390]|uniref:autotransporter domain-containing protein n=1 Tax=Neisseria sp. CCUG12390 TaxID=3392035 RepID=UPI003A10299E